MVLKSLPASVTDPHRDYFRPKRHNAIRGHRIQIQHQRAGTFRASCECGRWEYIPDFRRFEKPYLVRLMMDSYNIHFLAERRVARLGKWLAKAL